MLKRIGAFGYFIITLIASVGGVLGIFLLFVPKLNKQGWVGVLFLGLLALLFLGYNWYLYLTYSKKARYAEIFEDINLGFSEIHKTRRNESNSKEILRSLENLCEYISSSFEKIYGYKVRTCVKILVSDKDERPRVATLERDKRSKASGATTGIRDNVYHWIDENSDFEFIYNNIGDNYSSLSYHGTRLPIRKKYKNTRLKEENWPPKKRGFIIDYIKRKREWPLPYRSTLVVPITPLSGDEQSQSSLRGYLCVDSPKNLTFNKEYDVDILRGICDGIYDKIDKLFTQI